MKRALLPAALLCLLFLLTACGAQSGSGGETSAGEAKVTLESLCGEHYQSYITETITMQMENRMEKTPEVVYFPVEEHAPLTDYAVIDETTVFEADETGTVVIFFPAGAVTDTVNGEQSFRIPLP